MLTSDFIETLRLQVGDLKLLTQDTFEGDGVTVAFRLNERPIVESNYQVYVYSGAAWNLQTETTNYTIDKDTGILTMVSAPALGSSSGATNDENLRIDYKYSFLRDSDWLQIIKDCLRTWKKKLFTVATNETTHNTVDGQDEYDLDDISTDIFWVIVMEYKTSSEDDWHSIAEMGRNWRYEPTLNKIIVKPAFQATTYDIRYIYLSRLTVPSATTDTFSADTDFHPAIQKYCQALYLERLAMAKIKDTTALVKELSFHPAQTIFQYAKMLRQEAMEELALVKPRYPSQAIQILQEGRGR